MDNIRFSIYEFDVATGKIKKIASMVPIDLCKICPSKEICKNGQNQTKDCYNELKQKEIDFFIELFKEKNKKVTDQIEHEWHIFVKALQNELKGAIAIFQILNKVTKNRQEMKTLNFAMFCLNKIYKFKKVPLSSIVETLKIFNMTHLTDFLVEELIARNKIC